MRPELPCFLSDCDLTGQVLNLCFMVQIALMSRTFSNDGSLMAYSLSSGGSDWRTIHFLAISPEGSAEELPDVLHNVKFSSMAWTHDGKVRG